MIRPLALTLCALLAGCNSYDAFDPVGEPASAAPSVQTPTYTYSPVLSIEPWKFADADGSVIRTQHYRVFTTSDRTIIRRVLPGFLEASLVQYRSALGELPPPPVKLDTYLMDTRPQWASLTRALMQERADVYLQIERGGFAAQGRGVYRDLGALTDTLNLAAHEGWHQYTQLTFKSRLPVSLEEGIATYMEGFRFDPARPDVPVFMPWANTERYDQLRRAASADRLLSLDTLLTTPPQDLIARDQEMALTWYAQVWALVHFLHEGESGLYTSSLHAILADAATGSSRGVARLPLASYIQTPADELNEQYQAFINKITAPGARNKIVAGRSPLR